MRGMKKCEKCGAENADTAAICKACGEVLPVTAEWAAKINPGGAKQTAAKRAAATPDGGAASGRPSAWSPSIAAAGVFLVVASFFLMRVNAGITLAFGGAASVLAIVRADAEGRDGALGLGLGLLGTLAAIVGLILYATGGLGQ